MPGPIHDSGVEEQNIASNGEGKHGVASAVSDILVSLAEHEPAPVVDAMAVISIITLLAILVHRMRDNVLKFITTKEDYLVWMLTILPLITGYMAFHRIGLTAPTLLAIHILSVELLLVAFPFTKLMHAFTLVLARWYNGAISGYRGVES